MKHVVLVIDDDATIRELMTAMLTAAGHSVVLAGDGEEGCEIARLSRPTLIVCDVMLPDRIGYDVVADLQKFPETARTPVIFITGYAYVQQNTPQWDFCHWLLKPLSSTDLINKIEAVSRSSKAQCGRGQVEAH